ESNAPASPTEPLVEGSLSVASDVCESTLFAVVDGDGVEPSSVFVAWVVVGVSLVSSESLVPRVASSRSCKGWQLTPIRLKSPRQLEFDLNIKTSHSRKRRCRSHPSATSPRLTQYWANWH